MEYQQESIKGNWPFSRPTEHTKECHGRFDWLNPKTFSLKDRCYSRKVRESLDIYIATIQCYQDKVLNRDNENVVKTNA